jgi:L-amino acid N-acyltransferase YncA
MKISKRTYKHIGEAKAYFDLLKDLYGEIHGYDYYSGDLRNALQNCLEHPDQQLVCIAAEDENILQAHAALITDKRLPEGDVFFGFFECREERAVFDRLWEKVMTEARILKAARILGPVNGSIWHAYRVVSRSEPEYPVFNSEPITQAWYYPALLNKGPDEVIRYYSASRTDYGFITRHTEESYRQATEAGFTVVIPEEIGTDIVSQIYQIAAEAFTNSWAYTGLSLQEFVQLYSQDKIDKHIGKVYLLMKKDCIVGFCSTVRESPEKLIVKTIAIHPAYREKGFGNALVHKLHYDAGKAGIAEIIYALIRTGNQVANFPRDNAVHFREYASFNFRIM